jgi:protein SCO1
MIKSSGSKATLMRKLLNQNLFAQILALTFVICVIDPQIGSALQNSTATGRCIQVESERLLIPDVILLDQNANDVHFYTDLVKDMVVVISFFYTTCTLVCPAQGDNISKLQAMLGDRLGKDVFLISISFDPVKDTPAQIREYASRLGAKPGWTFVTGEKEVMNKFLKDFIGAVPSAGMHSSTMLIGNDKSGVWKLVDGMKPPADLIQVIQKVTN